MKLSKSFLSGLKIDVLLCFAFFLNPIIIKNFALYFYILEYGVAICYIIIKVKDVGALFSRIRLIDLYQIIGFFILLFLSFAYPTVHNTYDFSYVEVVLAVLRKFIILLFLFLILYNKYEDCDIISLFMKYYVLANILYVFGTIVFIAVPSLKGFWIANFGIVGARDDVLDSYGYIGRFGWAGYSGFRNTLDCSISILFIIFLRNRNLQGFSTTPTIGCIAICLIGNLLYGRVGILTSFLIVVIGLLDSHQINYKAIFVGSIALLISYYLIRYGVTHNELLKEWYIWFSTPIINLFTTGQLNNYSADHLFNEMIFLPNSSTLLFGDGMYTATDGHYYMNTDSGFMRQILFWGLFGTALSYGLTVLSIFKVINNNHLLKILFLVTLVVFEIKGEVFYEIWPLVFVIGLWGNVERTIIHGDM